MPRSFEKDDIYSAWHQRQQFPVLSTQEVADKIARLQFSLGRLEGVEVREFMPDVFLVERR